MNSGDNSKCPIHIIDEMIPIQPPEGGWKPEDLQIWLSKTNGKSIFAIEGDASSGIKWAEIQRQQEKNELPRMA